MAILDVQFRRGSLSFGSSTTFDENDQSVLGLLHSFATSLHQETGEPTAPLIGTVRRPSKDAYLRRLERELAAGEHDEVVLQLSEGWSVGGRATPLLVVVIGGCGELDGEAMEVGALALLPSGDDAPLRAIGGDLELFTMMIE